MNKTSLIIITLGLVIALGIIFSSSSRSNNASNDAELANGNNVEVKDGVQYVTVNARGGYWPKTSNAQAGIPTQLVVKTNGTYDCSAALVIPSINYKKILNQTGEEIIDLGTPKVGQVTQGVCGMGMYNFVINFS
ncbi:MAG: hypothetical protein Q8O46_03780 [bacterium]|nr:hypothetical protein [bacterium]